MDRSDEEVVSGVAASRRVRLTWAECRQPLWRAAIALYAPAVAPFLLSPLAECSHCVQNYLLLLPVMPGILAGAWCRDGVTFVVLALVATLLALGLVTLLVALAGRRWPWVAVPVAVITGAEAIGLGYLLRA